MKKGETYEGRVRDLIFPNKGIATVEGVDVAVKNTLPGQEISFILNKNKAGLKEGRLLSVDTRSDMEVLPGCSVCDSCGGCVYQRIAYDKELEIKDGMARDIIFRALKQHGISDRLDGIYEGITGSPEFSGYRNKMEFSFGNAVKDGPLTLGMHVPGHFMDVIDTPDCNIVDADFRLIRAYAAAYAHNHGLPFYHRQSGSGFLRNLLVRKGLNTGEILADIVTTTQGELDGEAFAAGIAKLPLHGSLAGVLHTMDDDVADTVKNEATEVIFGRDHIFDEVLGLRFRISPFSFFQTNTHGAEVLYSRVREYVKEAAGSGAGIVYDLYSGTGTIAQLMAGSTSRVFGVEVVPEAVEAAVINAGLNGIENAEFLCGDVLKVLDEVAEKPDLIILDPPRDGVNPKALRKILDYGVKYMVYVSCKITSLARDLHMMIDAGYEPVRMSVIDMFPRTANFESCVLLQRVSNTRPKAITLDVEMEDYYRIKGDRTND